VLQVPLAHRRFGYPVENIFEYAKGKKLSNAENLIYTLINAIGYWLNRHGSLQHQLPK
jgi:hypothetical protein